MDERHGSIKYLLGCLNPQILEHLGIFFGGGTAIALRLNEFRVSTDVDLFCRDDKALYAARHIAIEEGIQAFFSKNIPVTLHRVDHDGLKFFASVNGEEIKCEIFNLGLFPIKGEKISLYPIPSLTPYELFTAKLFANANRFMDSRNQNKDIIDLGAMLIAWENIPKTAWEAAYIKYGQADIDGAFKKATKRLSTRKELHTSAETLGLSTANIRKIVRTLNAECQRMENRPVMGIREKSGPTM